MISLFSELAVFSADATARPLIKLQLRLDALKSGTNKYDYKAVTANDTKEYATVVIATEAKPSAIEFHDTITLSPAFNSMFFERHLTYATNDLLHPRQITLDVGRADKKDREMSYERGELKVRGETQKIDLGEGEGILSFNAFLRLAPLLPRDAGHVYTFKRYGEPFLFRIREPKDDEGKWTLRCEGDEKISIGKKSYACVKFRLEMKTFEIQTDLWVSKADNIVVKFADTLPEGADAKSLEAILSD